MPTINDKGIRIQASVDLLDLLYMPPMLWGEGATLPPLSPDAEISICPPVPGQPVPPGKAYVVLGFDPETQDRYWQSRPPGERERIRQSLGLPKREPREAAFGPNGEEPQ